MRVVLSPKARRSYETLPVLVKVRLLGVFTRLGKWPSVSGAKPLRGNLWGMYRIRTGDYRVQFRIQGDEVVIVNVGHRDGFYDE